MLKVIFWGLVSVAIMISIGTWVVMLVAGAVHSEVASVSGVVQPWSFRESFFLSLGLAVLGSFFDFLWSYGSKS